MAIVLITGGTRGIGYAVAEALLARGDSVVVTSTTDDGAQRAEASLAAGANDATRVLGVMCDVRDRAAVHRMVATVVQRFGGLDVLVNNAGVGVGAPVEALSEEEWNRLIGINLTGVFHCCQAALAPLKARGGGWIVNVSSLAGKNPFAGGAAYCAAKAGVDAFSEALMQEVRHDGIRVSHVCPGSVATGFNGREPAAGADWKLHPEDVAQVIVDLLGHAGRSLPSRIEIRPSRPPRK
ncbi:MAG: SDR family oxidoreductase [Acidobacteria bacterium]|nr:SDR family oxidoreductase [Acidobacteriota bacterium]